MYRIKFQMALSILFGSNKNQFGADDPNVAVGCCIMVAKDSLKVSFLKLTQYRPDLFLRKNHLRAKTHIISVQIDRQFPKCNFR
jgi:hypothetical protein